jgi:hypothetical protein
LFRVIAEVPVRLALKLCVPDYEGWMDEISVKLAASIRSRVLIRVLVPALALAIH